MRALAILALLTAAPALAQSDNPGDDDSTLTVGVGIVTAPRFEGSDDNSLNPGGVLRGAIDGISFTTQGTALFVDLIKRQGQTGGKLVLGPVVSLNLDRISNKRTRDPQIIALGKKDLAVELGGQLGYSINGVITSEFDNLSINLAAVHDVTGEHDSFVLTPSISYGTPLSTSTYVGLSVASEYVGGGYGRSYFGVTPAQSLASGLPVYNPGSGFKDVSVSAVGALSLSGDLRRGLSLFALGSYQKLLGDFKRSPIVRDSDQWFGGVGLAYTF